MNEDRIKAEQKLSDYFGVFKRILKENSCWDFSHPAAIYDHPKLEEKLNAWDLDKGLQLMRDVRWMSERFNMDVTTKLCQGVIDYRGGVCDYVERLKKTSLWEHLVTETIRMDTVPGESFEPVSTSWEYVSDDCTVVEGGAWDDGKDWAWTDHNGKKVG